VESEREELGFDVCLACAKAGINQPEDIRGLIADVDCGELSIVTTKQYERVVTAFDYNKISNE
jgi:hypothetical protein